MIKRTVLFNIQLCIDFVGDYIKYNMEFEKFVAEFKNYIKYCYDGDCKIRITVGSYEFIYPDIVSKKMLPKIQIVASGRKPKNIDRLIENYINERFDLGLYNKIYLDKNPFSRKNDKLFSTISYRSYNLRIK